jgi:hypothetical protein
MILLGKLFSENRLRRNQPASAANSKTALDKQGHPGF